MLKNDICFTTDCNLNSFLKRCVFDEYDKDYLKVTAMLKTSDDTKDFVLKYLDCKAFENKQGYIELLKLYLPGFYQTRFLKMFDNADTFEVISDAGSVKIGNEAFTILIPNHYGDGSTTVGIFNNSDDFDDRFMSYVTSVSGKFFIFSYDCGNNAETKAALDGEYSIFSESGFVAFVKK